MKTTKQEKTQNEKSFDRWGNIILYGVVGLLALPLIARAGISIYYKRRLNKIYKDYYEENILKKRELPSLIDANEDGLIDLKYNKEIYLQTKKGEFISYSDALNKEHQKIKNAESKYKVKLDSIHQVKKDSLKKIFENGLEN